MKIEMLKLLNAMLHMIMHVRNPEIKIWFQMYGAVSHASTNIINKKTCSIV